MWLPRAGYGGEAAAQSKGGGGGVVAVAVAKEKNSQNALRWAVENLLSRGQTVILIHVLHNQIKSSSSFTVGSYGGEGSMPTREQREKLTKELFLTFHCYCTRKDINCIDIILEDNDIAKALTEYASYAAIEYLVLGASARHGFIRRFKTSDLPGSVTKGAPDFCTVYVISKGKISSAKKALRPAPYASPLLEQIQEQSNNTPSFAASARSKLSFSAKGTQRTIDRNRNFHDDSDTDRSPVRGRGLNAKLLCGELSESDTDLSFISSGRPSMDPMSNMFSDLDSGRTSRVSTSSEQSFGSLYFGAKGSEVGSLHDFSQSSFDSRGTSTSSQYTDEVDNEMRRLKMELLKTMDLYSTACKEALTAKQKAAELQRWRKEEEQKIEEARLAEEAARIAAEKEKAKCRAAMEKAEASQRVAELEAQRRVSAEMKARKNTEEEEEHEQQVVPTKDFRYRRYTIDEIEEATEFFAESRKIGEGGYGPVFKGTLDHTPVAIKVLRPDAAQGRSQFQQEVEVLSCMRHPNMVLLLGACPEYGCLVYEYMANGSLEDRLLRKDNTPPLSWQIRFKVAAEIATGILFLHQTKPEPIVHRDLKPANILLDRNYVSKISDVGLARLLPPSLAEDITQYRMTSTAGTFCYIDPEYQQTGMLGVKSDVYSLGILLLQVITAKPAMGLTHHVRRSIEKGTFVEMLDPCVPDWPFDEAMNFAKLALGCAELRRKDRPDLGKDVLPELNRLRELAEESMPQFVFNGGPSPSHSQSALTQVASNASIGDSEQNISKSLSSSSSTAEKSSGADE